jgi:ABC-type multidrug transport system fused ATPase/permease subunit
VLPLSMARALPKDSPILSPDKAIGALDAGIRTKPLAALDEAMTDRAAFVTARWRINRRSINDLCSAHTIH